MCATKVSVLGSTGSVGVQTLDVIGRLGYGVYALTGHSNIELLASQIRTFRPSLAVVATRAGALELRERIWPAKTRILCGSDGLLEAAAANETETVVAATLGIAGLEPVLAAVRAGKRIALANKETLVAGGTLVMDAVRASGALLTPVDSEHCAILQCIANAKPHEISRLILTASGGPFRSKSRQELESVTLEQALAHPTWRMGKKITVDSATLMNKGLEVIEAHWLFGVGAGQISVLVHPQSVVHSMAEFVDGSVMAQMGSPDMRTMIQYALTWPDREANLFSKLDLEAVGALTFEAPDMETFRCLKLAYEALAAGGTMPAAMNAANEEAVAAFMGERIRFLEIPEIVEKAMLAHRVVPHPDLQDILETDRRSKEFVRNNVI
jgi:1-deoxy-D-xylulose-5-phosphate reductoisomerase